MNKEQKQKNIYDLDYSKKLNHQNIFLILMGTAGITLLFKNLGLDTRLSILVKMLGSLMILLVLVAVVMYYNKELDEIKSEIEIL